MRPKGSLGAHGERRYQSGALEGAERARPPRRPRPIAPAGREDEALRGLRRIAVVAVGVAVGEEEHHPEDGGRGADPEADPAEDVAACRRCRCATARRARARCRRRGCRPGASGVADGAWERCWLTVVYSAASKSSCAVLRCWPFHTRNPTEPPARTRPPDAGDDAPRALGRDACSGRRASSPGSDRRRRRSAVVRPRVEGDVALDGQEPAALEEDVVRARREPQAVGGIDAARLAVDGDDRVRLAGRSTFRVPRRASRGRPVLLRLERHFP